MSPRVIGPPECLAYVRELHPSCRFCRFSTDVSGETRPLDHAFERWSVPSTCADSTPSRPLYPRRSIAFKIINERPAERDCRPGCSTVVSRIVVRAGRAKSDQQCACVVDHIPRRRASFSGRIAGNANTPVMTTTAAVTRKPVVRPEAMLPAVSMRWPVRERATRPGTGCRSRRRCRRPLHAGGRDDFGGGHVVQGNGDRDGAEGHPDQQQAWTRQRTGKSPLPRPPTHTAMPCAAPAQQRTETPRDLSTSMSRQTLRSRARLRPETALMAVAAAGSQAQLGPEVGGQPGVAPG